MLKKHKLKLTLAVISFIITIFLGSIILLTVGAGSSTIFGVRFFRVLTPSMSGTIEKDALVVTKYAPREDLKIGDIITFYSSNPDILDEVNTHRIFDIDGENFVTKGDANSIIDKEVTPYSKVIGKVVWQNENLGRIIAVMSSPMNMFLYIIIPILILSSWDLIRGAFKIKNSLSDDQNEADGKKEVTKEQKPRKKKTTSKKEEPVKKQTTSRKKEIAKEPKPVKKQATGKKKEVTKETNPVKKQITSRKKEVSKETEPIKKRATGKKKEVTKETNPVKKQTTSRKKAVSKEPEPIKKRATSKKKEVAKEQKPIKKQTTSRKKEITKETKPIKKQTAIKKKEVAKEQKPIKKRATSKKKEVTKETKPIKKQK